MGDNIGEYYRAYCGEYQEFREWLICPRTTIMGVCYPPRMENQMEKQMEHEMETGV